MDQQELRAAISSIQRTLEESAKVDAQSPTDKIFAELLLTGISVVGEMLLDVKRIADASGPPVHLHFHCPDGSVLNAVGEVVRIEPWSPPATLAPPFDGERLARFLAKREAAIKFGHYVVEEQDKWVGANWRAFQGEAAELLAAALPERGRT